MRLIPLLLLLFSLQASRAATLVTVPVGQPAQQASLSNSLAFNFETGGQAVIVSSIDIALTANLSATLYATSVFDPSNLPSGGGVSVSMTPSSVFAGGVSFDFTDAQVPGSSFFAVLLTFSSGEPFGSYLEGDISSTSTAGVSFHSVITLDLLGNPTTLSGSPAISVQGATVPEPGVVTLSLLAFLGFVGWRRRR